jgi:hypothetical protein
MGSGIKDITETGLMFVLKLKLASWRHYKTSIGVKLIGTKRGIISLMSFRLDY